MAGVEMLLSRSREWPGTVYTTMRAPRRTINLALQPSASRALSSRRNADGRVCSIHRAPENFIEIDILSLLQCKNATSHLASSKCIHRQPCDCCFTTGPGKANGSSCCSYSSFAYLSMKLLWNADSRSITPSISSSGGRNVVRKCHVPSF